MRHGLLRSDALRALLGRPVACAPDHGWQGRSTGVDGVGHGGLCLVGFGADLVGPSCACAHGTSGRGGRGQRIDFAADGAASLGRDLGACAIHRHGRPLCGPCRGLRPGHPHGCAQPRYRAPRHVGRSHNCGYGVCAARERSHGLHHGAHGALLPSLPLPLSLALLPRTLRRKLAGGCSRGARQRYARVLGRLGAVLADVHPSRKLGAGDLRPLHGRAHARLGN
mmetsp:Transcript_116909/g.249799  ORF Transcript_116909/g.249799 Transcript_116909/m.249799 type:complete len:224 (+) Transcript_116909:1113-1784(+)